jgi:hypothetical protein
MLHVLYTLTNDVSFPILGDENIQLIDRHETFYTFLRSMCQSGSNKLEISKVKHFVQTNYAVVKYRGRLFAQSVKIILI